MEVDCAKILWERSITKYKLRYTTKLCDGDSKAYASIVASKVYGEDIDIEKENCINHNSKRMGTSLRKGLKIIVGRKTPRRQGVPQASSCGKKLDE